MRWSAVRAGLSAALPCMSFNLRPANVRRRWGGSRIGVLLVRRPGSCCRPAAPAAIADGGATIGVPPRVEDSGLCRSAGPVQLGGTDMVAMIEERPRPADAELPIAQMGPSGPATARHRRLGLGGGLLSLHRSATHPRHIGRGCARHRRRRRRRRRTMPSFAGQCREQRPIRRCRGMQFSGQPLPRRRRSQHRTRTRARIHPSRIDFRRQHGDIQYCGHGYLSPKRDVMLNCVAAKLDS